MSKNSVRIWLIVSGLLAIGVAPFLAQGDQVTRLRIEQNRQTIAEMTLSERDHLERNFASYQKKSPQELASLQAFHQVIEEDRRTNTGELSKALNQYDQWLATIEPFQRDQLKETTDPQQRIRLMSEIVREQRTREASSVFRRRFENSPLADVPVLDQKQLLDLMEKVEELEQDRISLDQMSTLNRKEGVARFLKFLDLLKENSQLRPQDRAKIPRWIVKELFVTFRKIESQYISSIQDEAVRKYLIEESQDAREVSAPLRIQAVILKSILLQVMEQQNRSSMPAQAQLEELFSALPEEEQDELLQLEAIEFYKELIVRSEPTASEENQVSVHDVFEVFKPSREDDSRWPPGKRPPGEREGRPGNGPGDRERDGFRGERGGPGRPPRGDGTPPPRDDRRDQRPPE